MVANLWKVLEPPHYRSIMRGLKIDVLQKQSRKKDVMSVSQDSKLVCEGASTVASNARVCIHSQKLEEDL